jgi:hypothetical protein
MEYRITHATKNLKKEKRARTHRWLKVRQKRYALREIEIFVSSLSNENFAAIVIVCNLVHFSLFFLLGNCME